MERSPSGQRSHRDTWVVLEVHKQQFAIPASRVREIVAMPEVTVVPQSRPQDRGVINLRGRILPLIDIRKHFGWQSSAEELDAFHALIHQREEDHRNWLRELEKSVLENTAFRLATDPHKCAFGRWYDSYHPDSPWVAGLLRRFAAPHARIHAIAVSALELATAGKSDEAHRLIEQKRTGDLQEVVGLFQRLKEMVRDAVRELALVISAGRHPFALAIDAAVAVETIPPDRIQPVETARLTSVPGAVTQVAERTAGALALILDPEIFGAAGRTAPE